MGQDQPVKKYYSAQKLARIISVVGLAAVFVYFRTSLSRDYFVFSKVSRAFLKINGVRHLQTGSFLGSKIFSKVWKTVPLELTFQCSGGRLGNRMFFYTVVYGISRLNNRSGFIQKCNVIPCEKHEKWCWHESLEEMFELSLPVREDLPEEEQVGHAIKVHLRFPEDYHIPPEANILVGEAYPCSVSHFLHVQEEVRQEFRFLKQYQDHADSFLEQARGSRQNVTLVGVHVRRSDYFSLLLKHKKPRAPRKFYKYALNYFRKKFPNVLFVVLSDDLPWCRKNIVGDDVYVARKMFSPGRDLAALSCCQHTIFDYGTFGFWGAFLTGGTVVYFADGIVDSAHPDTELSKRMYPPEWIGVSIAMIESFI